MSEDERSLARIRKHLVEEFPGGLSATDFVWKFLCEEDLRIGLSRPLEEFDQVHMGFRKEIKKLAVSRVGEKVNLADELKSAASSYSNRSILIDAWLLELDKKLSSLPGDSPKKIPAPEILSFDVDKTTVAMNGTVALRWRTQNTTSVLLEQKTETETILMSRVVEMAGTWNATGIRQNCVFELKAIQSATVVSRRQLVKLHLEPSPPTSSSPRPAPKPSPASPSPPPSHDNLVIRTYSVTPQHPQKGGAVVVHWTISGAASAELELKARGRSISKFHVPASGSHRFANFQGSASAELTATGFDGKTIQQSIQISTVKSYRMPVAAAIIVLLLFLASFVLREYSLRKPQPPLAAAAEILSLEARPSYVRSGGTVTLRWRTNNAAQVNINGRTVATSGSQTIPHLHRRSTFVLVVTSADGTQIRKSVEVKLQQNQESALQPPVQPEPNFEPSASSQNKPSPDTGKTPFLIESHPVTLPPAIDQFSVTPTTIEQGQTAVLQWTVRNATSLGIDPPLGISFGDRVQVTPDKTTTYTITARGEGDPVTRSVTLTVTQREAESAAALSEGYFSCMAAPVAVGGLATFSSGESQIVFPAGHYRFEIAPAYPWRVLIKPQVNGTKIVTVTPLTNVALANCRLHWTRLQE